VKILGEIAILETNKPTIEEFCLNLKFFKFVAKVVVYNKEQPCPKKKPKNKKG
jgi:hypothetical protein